MKQLFLLLFACILLTACGTYMSCKEYFGVRSTNNIATYPDSLYYQTDALDLHVGTISRPIMKYDFSFDTLSHYRIMVCGDVFFHQNEYSADSMYWDAVIDSVALKSFYVKKKGFPAEHFSASDKGNRSSGKKSWKKLHIPDSLLLLIREDFYVRMKYTRYRFRKDYQISGISTAYPYELYNSGRNY
ncbi:MAG: hypothetical protein Q4E58_13470 [Prevotellaceae bacterium]|jgi:hypothetical protein|nr:hypothetical protein [Prevotellaceae bacterium]